MTPVQWAKVDAGEQAGTPLEEALAELAGWLGVAERRIPPGPDASGRLQVLLAKVWSTAGAPDRVERGGSVQNRLREVLCPLFHESATARRCYEKPRGYPGDYLMMEHIYEQKPRGETPLGYWLDDWLLRQPVAVAVRHRRSWLAELLVRESTRGRLRVMNVACGKARELADAATVASFGSVTLLDQDGGALAAATEHLGEALRGNSAPPSAIITCSRPIRDLVSGAMKAPADQDVIYSLGLYNYLTAENATALTSRLWSAVAPGGLLAVGNFGGNPPMRCILEQLLDWYLLYRTPSDLLDLAAALPAVADAKVWADDTGCYFLLLVRKKRRHRRFAWPRRVEPRPARRPAGAPDRPALR